MKKCTTCKATKPLSLFTIRSDTKKHKNECKACVNNRVTQKRYGITLAEYDILLTEQEGACAICGTMDPRASRFHIDHNHETGEIRGLLCGPCNQGIGLLQDSPTILRKATEYLETNGYYGD